MLQSKKTVKVNAAEKTVKANGCDEDMNDENDDPKKLVAKKRVSTSNPSMITRKRRRLQNSFEAASSQGNSKEIRK